MLALVALLTFAPPPTWHMRDRIAVVERHRDGARACLVHLHGNEVLARAAMRAFDNTCTNAMWIDDARTGSPFASDRIPVPTSDGGGCTVNPNRVLTPAGFDVAIYRDCGADPVARAELRSFLDDVLLPAIERCRAPDLLVVALHNNSILTVGDLDTKKTAARDKKSHDILLVTDAADFDRLSALRKKWSVGLQSTPPLDDGSLSVLLQHTRYINVEAHIAPKNAANNLAMAQAAVSSSSIATCDANSIELDAAHHARVPR